MIGSELTGGHELLRVVRTGLVAFSISMILAGCGGGGSEPTPTVAPLLTATPFSNTPTPIPPPSVGEVVWTTSVNPGSNAPGNPVNQFRSSDPDIYAVVEVANLPAGAVLSALWSYNGVPLEGVTAGVVPSSAYPGGFVEFHISKSIGEVWPDGMYVINVLLNGDVEQVSEIEVVAQ